MISSEESSQTSLEDSTEEESFESTESSYASSSFQYEEAKTEEQQTTLSTRDELLENLQAELAILKQQYAEEQAAHAITQQELVALKTFWEKKSRQDEQIIKQLLQQKARELEQQRAELERCREQLNETEIQLKEQEYTKQERLCSYLNDAISDVSAQIELEICELEAEKAQADEDSEFTEEADKYRTIYNKFKKVFWKLVPELFKPAHERKPEAEIDRLLAKCKEMQKKLNQQRTRL